MTLLKNSPAVPVAATSKARKSQTTRNTDEAEYKAFKQAFLKQNPEIDSYSFSFRKWCSLL